MSDSIRTGEATSDPAGENSPRREFLKAMVTAVAGLTLAGGAEAQTRSRTTAGSTTTVTGGAQKRLAESLQAYRTALRGGRSDSLKPFFSSATDFRSTRGIKRAWDDLAGEIGNDSALLRGRADGFITHVKWLSPTIALVDGNFEIGDGRGWFTEIWSGGQKFTLDATRLRAGKADEGFRALDAVTSGAVAGGVPAAVARREEAALRQNFKAFRTAFNAGDVAGVVALTTATVDAIPVFSFLDGRAQILAGAGAVGSKAERMLGQEVINPSPEMALRAAPAARRATYVAGEPKVIRFLSPTLALVDGTAEINNIPSAHEFSPKSMRGVYSTVWTKVGNRWKAEATRPWF